VKQTPSIEPLNPLPEVVIEFNIRKRWLRPGIRSIKSWSSFTRL
jgi:hypothetical protein